LQASGFPRGTARNPAESEVNSYGDPRKRALGGTKLNEAELRAFEVLVEKRRQTQGEFIRDLIAAEVRRDQKGETPSPEMVEIVAVRLLLMNMFKSLLVTGDLLPAEKWEWYLTEITKRKRGFAADMLASHRKEERKKP
jgi:hypothetical protein